MEFIRTLLEQQPLMALFLTIAIGYLVGEINLKGFSLGVGAVLFVALGMGWFAPRALPGGTELLEIAVRNPELSGKSLGDIMTALPATVRIVALRRDGRNEPASPNLVVAENDVVLAVAASKSALAEAGKILGEAAPGHVLKDRGDLDYLRVFTSRPNVVGRTLGELNLPGEKAGIIVQVRRGDTDIQPQPELVLESGDRVGLLAHRDDFAAMRQYFGDSIKTTAEFSYIGIGIGMALGFLIGAIQVPLPGIGKISVGLRGVLIMALILGKLRRTGRVCWTIPLTANVVIRNLGLTIFLAQVGMSSGPKFAATFTETGFVMLGLGAVVLVALVVPMLILGLFVFKMPYDEVAGIVAGGCGNPAILAYANKLAPTDRPDIGYAMIFPSMTIVKILFVDIIPALF